MKITLKTQMTSILTMQDIIGPALQHWNYVCLVVFILNTEY